MDNLNQYNSDLKQLSDLLERLANGELSIEELTKLEEVTRRLHERSIILKYKAYEGHSTPNSTDESKEEQNQEQKEEILEDDDPSFDMSIFDVTVEDIEKEIEEEEIEAGTDDPATEAEEKDEESIVDEPTGSDEKSFIDQLDLNDNSLASSFAGGKLDSLIGAFGLNERLRFINNLFDGSSELFSDAVKSLDTQSDFESAKQTIDTLASEHNWDPEDDSVLEFMTYVNRRYA